MKIQAIVYVTDMGRSRDWYARVLDTAPAYESDMWTPFPVGDATVALHGTSDLPEASRGALSLVSDQPLEEVVRRLASVGVACDDGIRDQPFGRSLLLRDPDGTPIQVNEHA